jgi:hypothetical protein
MMNGEIIIMSLNLVFLLDLAHTITLFYCPTIITEM